MTTKTETAKTPPVPSEQPEDQRAIHIPTFLSRILPYYGQPAWLAAQHWRQFVRNQPVAIVCRDTLMNNMLNLEWDIVPSDVKEIINSHLNVVSAPFPGAAHWSWHRQGFARSIVLLWLSILVRLPGKIHRRCRQRCTLQSCTRSLPGV